MENSFITPHFQWHEFGGTAAPDAIKTNLRRLCENLLEPLRTHLDTPIQITSGYRTPKHNRLVGGVANSAHLHGLAADFVLSGHSSAEAQQRVCDALKQLALPFDQLILYDTFIHLALRPQGDNRFQILNQNSRK